MSPIHAFLDASNGDRLANIGTAGTYAGGVAVGAVELIATTTHALPEMAPSIGLGPLLVVSFLTGWRIFIGRQSESDRLRHEREAEAEQHRHDEEMKRLERDYIVALTGRINAAVSAKAHGVNIDPLTGEPIATAIITPEPFDDQDRRD